MKEYQLNLSAEEIKLVLDLLFERPFKDVFDLIGKINEQIVFQERNPNAKNDLKPSIDN